jgi:hypothetical protein
MGVDCHSGLTKGSIENDVRSLSANAWKHFQLFSILRNFAAVFIQEELASFLNVPALGIK